MGDINNADNVTERVPLLRTAESDELEKFRLQLDSDERIKVEEIKSRERMFNSLPQADKLSFLVEEMNDKSRERLQMVDSLPQADKLKFLERIWFEDKVHKGKFQRLLPFLTNI